MRIAFGQPRRVQMTPHPAGTTQRARSHSIASAVFVSLNTAACSVHDFPLVV